MTRESMFLLLAAVGLTPIALAYGAVPSASMPYLYGITVDNVSSLHVFRAVMGLYLAMVVFWIAGARNSAMTLPALWSVLVFMFGLAAGRVLSLVLDGVPSVLLVVYLVLEIGFGLVALALIRRHPGY